MGQGKFIDWDTPETLMKIRKLVRQDKTASEIKEALGWTVGVSTVNDRLRRYGMRARNPQPRAHRGDETTTPDP
jgi:hypothetical protein